MADRPALRRRGPFGAITASRGLDVLFVSLLAIYVACGRDAVPFHGDESTFLWMSRDADRVLFSGDVRGLAFAPDTREPLAQSLRLLNGSLTPLAIGITWRAAGYSRDDLNRPWVWVLPERPASEQWRFNVSAGRLPDPALLSWARLPSTLFTAASVALVFALALSFSRSRAAAWVAAAAYATTPAVLLNGRRAMQEGGLLLATALVVWLALAALRARPRGSSSLPTGGLLALAATAGIAAAAKHSAVAVCAAAWLVLACAPWLRSPRPDAATAARHGIALAGAGIGSLAVFTGLTPIWASPPRTGALAALAAGLLSFGLPLSRRSAWALRAGAITVFAGALLAQPTALGDGAAAAGRIIAERRALLAEQLGEREPPALAARAGTLAREAFVAEAEFFEDPGWAEFPAITRQIDAYRASFLAGRIGFLRWPGGLLLAALASVGAIALLRRPLAPEGVLLAAWLAIPALLLLANPLPWQRYYLLLHAPLAVFAGLGVSALLHRQEAPA